MLRFCVYKLLLLLSFASFSTARGQHLSFRHLGIAEGMPSNVTGHACFDSTGFVWIATNDGLISYDGTRIRQYLKETHPGLPRNEIGNLFCDSRNRIWICTNEGLALLNEQRRISRVVIHDSLKNANIDFCFEVAGKGMFASSEKKTYFLPTGKTGWQVVKWFDEQVRRNAGISNLRPFNKTTYMFVMAGKAMLVDFAAQKVITELAVSNISSVCKLSDNELLATTGQEFSLFRISLNDQRIVKKYSGVSDVDGNPVTAPSFSSSKAADGMVYISTRAGGLIRFDVGKELFYTSRHQPLNNNSVSSDILRWVFCHPEGYLLITSTSGLNYTNVLVATFRQQNNFIDGSGVIIDGGITGVAEDSNGSIWIKVLNKLFIWNAKTNLARNISLPEKIMGGAETGTEAGTINRDARNNMWVTYNSRGLAKFTTDGRLIQFLNTTSSSPLPVNSIRLTKQLANGMIIAGADNRLFMLHPETFRIDSFDTHPLLKSIAKKRIVDILPDGDKVWIASSPGGGAYCYDFKKKELITFSSKNGLSTDRVYSLTKDSLGNMYVGTYDGLNIISPDGKISIINKHNGLRHPRVENLVTDRQGKVWITNFNSVICYNPVNKSFHYFDERNGISNAGFAVAGNSITRDGHILFSNGGLLMIDPAAANPAEEYHPPVAIHRLYDDGGYELLSVNTPVRLPYNNAKLSLYYLSNNLVTANRFFYRYKMEGLDTGWQQPTKNNEVTYKLSPGKYHFLMQTSYNEGGWRVNGNRITVIVAPPWWQTWWFRSLVAFVLGAIILLLFRRRVAIIKQKAGISQQMAELEGKALRAQMNPHFIFNSLNAIQELVITENYTASYQYLSKFSRLLRLVLNNSEKNLIPLRSEIEVTQLYLELESLRFKQSFHYNIAVDEKIDTDTTMFPSLLLQPFIENAIWHGLMHKEGDKKLNIVFTEENNSLYCIITDNGIGRSKSAEIKASKLGAHHFDSKGTRLALQRIQTLRQSGLLGAAIRTDDLYDKNGNACGTSVELIIPLPKISPSV